MTTSTVGAEPEHRPERQGASRTSKVLPYVLLLPSVTLLIAFFAAPFLSLFYFSLNRVELGGESTFIGVGNFLYLFGESRFHRNLVATMAYLVGVLVVSIPLAYLAAGLISRGLRGIGALRTILIIPWVLAPVVTALLFRTLMDPSNGPITTALGWISGDAAGLMQDENGALLVIILHSAWRSLPIEMLVLAAGLSTIPKELYEAVRIDGGGWFAEFRHLTLPLTRPQLLSAVIIVSVFTLHDAESVFALTQGGPGYSTEVTAVRLFKEAFRYYDVGTGSAIGVLLVALTVAVLGLLILIAGRNRELSS